MPRQHAGLMGSSAAFCCSSLHLIFKRMNEKVSFDTRNVFLKRVLEYDRHKFSHHPVFRESLRHVLLLDYDSLAVADAVSNNTSKIAAFILLRLIAINILKRASERRCLRVLSPTKRLKINNGMQFPLSAMMFGITGTSNYF